MSAYRIKPQLRTFRFLATALTSLSHHDPAQGGAKSNIRLFRREDTKIERTLTDIPTADDVQALVRSIPVPESIAPMFSGLSPAQFLAVAFLQRFIAANNGQGLMDGIDRYRLLESRARIAAINATGGFSFWGRLSSDMKVPGIASNEKDDAESALVRLLTMPAALAQVIFMEIMDNAGSVVTLAHMWNNTLWSELKAGSRYVALTLADQPFSDSRSVVVPLPAVSANSLRHEMIREPGMWHLLNALELDSNNLPPGVTAMLYNGGDLNESEPSNAFKLTRQVRDALPLISLIGGSTKGFILGSSNLDVSCWLVCNEHAQTLDERFGITPELSAFDLLTRIEMTRHTNKRVEGSPMPYGFEALVAGAQIAVELRLRPYANDLELGALVAALGTYIDADSTAFGQAARGFGLLKVDTLQTPDVDLQAAQEQYETYLRENALFLRDGLETGKLGTEKVLC